MIDVVFVVMPFADIGRPAIGVSLLKAAALGAGYSATIQYCNLRLAELMGQQTYQSVSSSFAPGLILQCPKQSRRKSREIGWLSRERQ